MLIDHEKIVHFLLEHELITKSSIVSNDLILADASRRNYNIKILSHTGPCYFLKQETRDQVAGDPKFATVAYEAEIYLLLQSLEGNQTLFQYFPRYYGYDAVQHILILEGLFDSISLAEFQFHKRRTDVRLGDKLGRALATLHEGTAAIRTTIEKLPSISTVPPWVFFINQPSHWIYLNSSAASLELVGILQQSVELCERLEYIRHQWHAETLIHGDFRWDNCMLLQRSSSRKPDRVKIIDWELAQLGDPCWDVGVFFSEYLSVWLASIPFSQKMALDQSLNLARFPLSKMQPAIQAFWKAYVLSLKLDSIAVTNRLLRATQYAGLRLVQTAYERLQNQSSITPLDIYILQLCVNLVTRPVEAVIHLLGLPWWE